MVKHLTATAYLVARINGKIKVFLHQHKKIGIWMGVGGHVEKNENPLETLLREVKEEIGVTPRLLPPFKEPERGAYYRELPVPPILFEFKVKKHGEESAHYHIDFVYFGTVPHPQEIRMAEVFGWFSASELKQLELQQEVVYITREALKLGKLYL